MTEQFNLIKLSRISNAVTYELISKKYGAIHYNKLSKEFIFWDLGLNFNIN